MATNAFSSLFGSLAGGLAPKATATKSSPYQTYVNNLTSAPSGRLVSANRSVAPTGLQGNQASFVSDAKANAVASKGNVPYVPATSTGGGRSVVPTYSSNSTGKPAAGGSGVVAPKPASTTTSPTSSARSTFITNAAATSPTPTTTSSTTEPAIGGAGDSSASAPASAPTAGYSGAAFGGTSTAPTGTGSDYRSQYLNLLSGLYSEDELKSANKNLLDINRRASDVTLRGRDEEERIRKNEAGALARGVNSQMSENSRLTSKELADLAIAGDPYKTFVNSALSAYKGAADMNPDGFTLSSGQSRYEFDPATGGYKQVGASGATGSMDINDPTVQAWAKGIRSNQYQIGNVPENIRNIVAQAVGSLPAGTNPVVQQAQAKASIVLGTDGQAGLIDQAINQVGTLTSGFLGKVGSMVPGTPQYDLSQTISTLKANLAFDTLQSMRAASPTGGALGAVSEKELALLENAISALDLGQSQAQLRQNLQSVKTHYQNWYNAVLQSANAGGGTATGGGGAFATAW